MKAWLDELGTMNGLTQAAVFGIGVGLALSAFVSAKIAAMVGVAAFLLLAYCALKRPGAETPDYPARLDLGGAELSPEEQQRYESGLVKRALRQREQAAEDRASLGYMWDIVVCLIAITGAALWFLAR